MTFAGIVTTLLTVQLPDNEVDTLINVLGDAFGLPEEMKMFLVERYLPEVLNMRLIFSLISIKFNQIRTATEEVNIGLLELAQLELDTVATLMKLIYAFLWQEYVLTNNDLFLDPEVNVIGASLMGTVNGLANWLNSFPVLSENLQTGYGVYPGDTW